MKSFEEMEKVLSECVKDGFPSIPIEERVKQLEEQRKRVEESEKCYKVTKEQLQRQFTL